MQLDGARALVGGASRGLVGPIAEALAGEGVRVAAVARRPEAVAAVAHLRTGGVPVPVDLSEPDGPARAVQTAVEALGGLDLLVVNSGGPPPGDFRGLDEAAWTRAIQGTLLSSLRLVRAALPHLDASDRAAIVVILSSSVRSPSPRPLAANVLRPGLVGLIKSLAVELAPNVRINGVAPGKVDTDRVAESSTRAAHSARGRASRSCARRSSAASRSAATASPPRSAGSPRTCSRPPRATSRARSCSWRRLVPALP